jgi:hypothetical protein
MPRPSSPPLRNLLKQRLQERLPRTARLAGRLAAWARAAPLRLQCAERVFTGIHRANAWRGGASRSGPGSDPAQTAALAQELPPLLSRLGCRVLLDAPCGDCFWMSSLPLAECGVESYVGIDIVADLIAANVRLHGAPGRTFLRLDLVREPLPRADLILCRDGLVHLSFRDARAALAGFRASGATWLLATTFRRHPRNRDIATGEWRPLNLELPPFSFPPPLAVIDERCTEEEGRYADKALGLWRLQ